MRKLDTATTITHPVSDATDNKPAAGFTLIEVLVTILLISIVLGIALLRIDLDSIDARLREHSGRMARMMELADQQAIFQSLDIGMLLLKDRYRFFYLDKDKWLATEDPLLKEQRLDEDIEMVATIEGAEVALRDRAQKEPVPQIIFSSSGEWTSFEIQFTEQGKHELIYTLSNTQTGVLDIQRESNTYE